MVSMKSVGRAVLGLVFMLNVQAVDAKETSLTIGLIGDSTVASTYGWGPAFAKRFKNDTNVFNYAKNCAMLESLSDKLDELLARKPEL